MNDFYVTGGPVLPDIASYVHRQADDELYHALLAEEYCYVLNARQMGKSSLKLRTATRLTAAGVNTVLLDLTNVGVNLTPEQWYFGLLSRLGRRLKLGPEIEDFWQAHSELGPLQRWQQALEQEVIPRHMGLVVIFIDEIDAVRSLPFSTDEFFAAIREFYNRRSQEPELRRLTFCLIGVATPSDLIRDTRMTPFNVGRRIELNDFSSTEARPLAQGFGHDKKIAAALLDRVLYWTGGHPYLTQKLCQAIALDIAVQQPGDVNRVCEGLFFTVRARERDDNLLFVRDRLLRGEVDRAGLLDLYRQVVRQKKVRDEEINPLIDALRLAGIIRIKKNYLAVRNRIYERVFDYEWVKSNMPDAELRRQRAAYRRGLIRAAAIASLILLLVSGLAAYAFIQRQRADQTAKELQAPLASAEEQAANNRRLLYASRATLIQREYEDKKFANVHELLELQRPNSNEDLRGFEWYWYQQLSHYLFTLKGHTESVNSVAFSPDGQRLVSGSFDNTVKVWDSQTGQDLLTLKGHTGWVYSVAFSPDGERLLSGSRDQTVKLWDSKTGQEVLTLKGHTSWVNSVAFSPDGQQLASGSEDGTVKLWDSRTGQQRLTLKDMASVNTVAFSPDGQRLASGSEDGTVKLWDSRTGQGLLTFIDDAGSAGSVAFSPDGQRLASASFGGVTVWDSRTGQEVLTVIKEWDSRTGQEVFKPIKDDTEVHIDDDPHTDDSPNDGNIMASVAFSPDGQHIATVTNDSRVKVLDSRTGQVVLTLEGHTSLDIGSLVFSPDGQRLASASGDSTVKVWDVGKRQGVFTLKSDYEVESVAFSPDGQRLASRDSASPVEVWDSRAGQLLVTHRGQGHTLEDTSIAFSPDGERLASGNGGRVQVWDSRTRQLLLTLTGGHTRPITSLAFSPDGQRLASASFDDPVIVWDSKTGKRIFTIASNANHISSLAFSPDGQRLASGNWENIVKLWDSKTGQLLLTLRGHSDQVTSVAFSPDGQRLASGSYDGTVKLWDSKTGQEVLTLKGHTDSVNSVAFSPDGQRLASGSNDKTVKIWMVERTQDVAAQKDRKEK